MNTELLLAVVVASATSIYTLVTIFQLIESRKVRLQKETPNIVAYLKSSENHETLYLIIKNFGEGVAKNVNVKFIKDFKRFARQDFLLSHIGISENGLNLFPPNHFFQYGIGIMTTLYEENKEDSIELLISYESFDNRRFKTKFNLPLNQIFGQSYSKPPETYIGQIPYFLKEISDQLKKMNNFTESEIEQNNY